MREKRVYLAYVCVCVLGTMSCGNQMENKDPMNVH